MRHPQPHYPVTALIVTAVAAIVLVDIGKYHISHELWDEVAGEGVSSSWPPSLHPRSPRLQQFFNGPMRPVGEAPTALL